MLVVQQVLCDFLFPDIVSQVLIKLSTSQT